MSKNKARKQKTAAIKRKKAEKRKRKQASKKANEREFFFDGPVFGDDLFEDSPFDNPPPFPDRRAMEGILAGLPLGSGVWDEDSPQARAQQIMYEAFDASPSQQKNLVRKALDVCPDCTDAYLLLAEEARSFDEVKELLQKAVASGERALGEETFRDCAEHFWGVLETRPYMRAKLELAQCLWADGQRDKSIEHCRDMLRLNPMDNQGVRWLLLRYYLETNCHKDAEQLLEQFEEDDTAHWMYGNVLLTFRREGDSKSARKALAEAQKGNEYVPRCLLGDVHIPRELPGHFSPGGEDEAMLYASEFLPSWRATPGAIAWLRTASGVGLPGPGPESFDFYDFADELRELPQVERELWQVDIRRLPADCMMEGEEKPPWAAIVVDAASGEGVALETQPDRPTDGDILEALVGAMLHPLVGEPRRPEMIQTATKKRVKVWNKRLDNVQIACQYLKSMEHVDRAIESLSEFLPRASNRMSSGNMADDIRQVLELPQAFDEVWQMDAYQMSTWIDMDDAPGRPWVILVGDRTNDVVLMFELSPGSPSPEQFRARLADAMHGPLAGEPHRPREVEVRSEDHRRIVTPLLEEVGVQCTVSNDLDMLDHAYRSLSAQFEGDSPHLALVDIPDVEPKHVGGLYEAAADFYRRTPWRDVPDDTGLRIESEQLKGGPWHVVVMGQSGMAPGLAVYFDEECLRSHLSGNLSDEEAGEQTSAMSLMFDEEFTIAAADLEAAEQFGWPVATPEAYPCTMRIEPGPKLQALAASELELLEACLRAIPDFLKSDQQRQQIDVSTAFRTAKLDLSWPELG